MISRRLIRIKVFKLLFSRICSESRSLINAGNELMLSLEKTVDLYWLLLSLPIALKNYGISKINMGLQKFQPTPDEVDPNRKFILNRVIHVLENDKDRRDHSTKRGLYWTEQQTFVKKLYLDLHSRSWFNDYMEDKSGSYRQDMELLQTFFRLELEDNEDLYEILEDQSIYWVDDVAYILGIILKMLSSLKEGGAPEHLEMFKQQEDKEYALRLLEHSILHYDEYVELLRTFAHNWEVDRMASTDICLIVLGVSEVVCCPTIPVKVTINEVVELAKYYSTSNSRVFVNGVLDKIIQHLKEEGKIQKEGRGLMEN
jgi:N utilization substance protein B